MNYSKLAYKTASWSFIVVGIGHLTTDLLKPKTTEQLMFIQTMKDFSINLMGTEVNVFSFHQGYSIMMGLLLFAYGALNLILLKNNKEKRLGSNILVFNCIISFACTVLSFMYFFIIPIVLTGVAFLGFTVSLLKNKAS
jgi:hypothetical protein